MQNNFNFDSKLIERLLFEIQSDPMGGWYDLPNTFNIDELNRIKKTAEKIQSDSKYLVCIGIGGSYLGHRAIIEALSPKSPTKILYAGNSLSTRELDKVITEIGDADFSVLVISKSGTTMEPALAFETFKQKLIQKYGDKDFAARIYATTDSEKGKLHDEAVENNYERFVVPNDIGGRYSVLTAVGLLPMAVAGINLDQLFAGAKKCRSDMLKENDLENSMLVRYAFDRFRLYKKDGCDVEVLASFEPSMMYFNEWWKQLFGESEGKNYQGIFPASVIYSTDLHSLGQYMQQGRRNIFETIIEFADNSGANLAAEQATVYAHRLGGIEVLEIKVPTLDEFSLGFLVHFFETACALSAKLMGVNPFDQPGVEVYKQKMRELL